MQIILVSNRLSKTRTVEVTWTHGLMALASLSAGVILLSFLISYFGVRHAADIQLPLLQSLLQSANQAQEQKTQDFLRSNLNVMAVKLGQLQAQLTRLDALGERLSTSAGIKPGEFRFNEIPGRGGALASLAPPHDLSLGELSRQLDFVARGTETRTDYLGIVDSQLLDQRVRRRLLPTSLPLDVGTWNASGFGWRLDPITGQGSLHEGIDFIAPAGTPVYAAASGIVLTAEFHPTYGYMIDLDHGHEMVTRYAHSSKLLVKEGELVKRGQKIAEVGSTGRSTGAHLHFEVRHKGTPQNPARFLQASAK